METPVPPLPNGVTVIFSGESPGPGPPGSGAGARPRPVSAADAKHTAAAARRLDSLTQTGPPTATQALLKQLLSTSLIALDDWQAAPAAAQADLKRLRDPMALLEELVSRGMLTEYQASRVAAGKLFGLVLGNYRVLARLGSGGMGVVYKAEHTRLRRQVAVKVLHAHPEPDPGMLMRFFAEVRAAAQLQHPNIVAALDVGEVANPDTELPPLHYFVMEYVAGKDLEDYVNEQGALPIVTACDLASQVASALAEAEKNNLVHRDIKPSNVLVTPEGQAKLLDFGLARHLGNRMTQPGVVLGTLDYMAPEQAIDASSVDIRADIYGLGGLLFWCLTGKPPFQCNGDLPAYLARRQSQLPTPLRDLRPDAPAGLEAVLQRMMAVRPEDRYSSPRELIRALLPFVQAGGVCRNTPAAVGLSGLAAPVGPTGRRVLIVDDEDGLRRYCKLVLQSEGLECDEAANGRQAMAAVAARDYDLVLLDYNLPDTNGAELLRSFRAGGEAKHLKVIMMSGGGHADDLARALLDSADDYLLKPFSVLQLRARVQIMVRLQTALQRFDQVNHNLLTLNAELERNLTARHSDLVHARNALIMALAKLVQTRDTETPAHLVRLQKYVRVLAEEASTLRGFASMLDVNFLEVLEYCTPLHDIGKVGLPDHILMKPGKLDEDERLLMQAHTTIGSDLLKQVAAEHGNALSFLQMAADIARHHHERFDGTGYPDRLAGTAIPLSARLVAVCDVYDALRSRRSYKPALSHGTAVLAMTQAAGGQFDPGLVEAFQRCAPQFDRIYREHPDQG